MSQRTPQNDPRWEGKTRRSYLPCPTCGGPRARHASYCRACSPLITRGEDHYAWKGADALSTTKRRRVALREIMLPGDAPCERCGAPAMDRHHRDGDPGNNAAENIASLCRHCHMSVDGRGASRDASGRFVGWAA